MKKTFYGILLMFVILGCKEEAKVGEKKEITSSIEEKESINKELEVYLNFKTNKSDEFKLMLNNVVVDEFQKKNIHIIEKTEPTTSFDETNARFGNNNLSNNFNINFGAKEVKEVEISTIKMTYGENSIIIKGTELEEYFNINKYINYDPVTGVLRTQKIDGKHYPTILVKRKVINMLKKETFDE